MLEGMDAESHFTKILAKVPLAEIHDYSSSLRSISQGRAKFKIKFDEYAAVPPDTQKKLFDEYNRTVKEEV
jgi:elongation factor G